jgi:hypothetical protein
MPSALSNRGVPRFAFFKPSAKLSAAVVPTTNIEADKLATYLNAVLLKEGQRVTNCRP